MTRSKEDYENLQREARNNAVHKTPIDMARELSSRVGAIFSNFDEGPQNIARYEVEIENDIVKSLALAKYLIYRLETAERHVAMVCEFENQDKYVDKQEKFGGNKNVDNEDSYEYKREMKHHKKIGKEKRKAEKKRDKEIDAKALIIVNLILEDRQVDRATNVHLDFCYGDSDTSMKLYRKVEWEIDERLGGGPGSKLAYQIYKNRVRNEWDLRKAVEAAQAEAAKDTAEESELAQSEDDKTLDDVIKDLEEFISEGTLSREEAYRRANIAAFNEVYLNYQNTLTALEEAKGFHPETRQVIAGEAVVFIKLGREIGKKVGLNLV